jgi:hypothetical protein
MRVGSWLGIMVTAAMMVLGAAGQRPARALTGTVLDPAGKAVAGAQITVLAADGTSHVARSGAHGRFTIRGLASGQAVMVVNARGFAPFRKTIAAGAAAALEIHLALAGNRQQVVVSATAAKVNLRPSDQAAAVTLSGKALQSLAIDPDELATDLAELAGPAVGGAGGTIYVNGFTRGDIPPKADIESVEVNNDPYSPKYSRLGYGRIEIHTKPGTAAFHGQVTYDGNRSGFNSLSPFLAASATPPPAYNSNIFSASVGGPLGKRRISWFVSVERRNISNVSVVNAQILDSGLAPQTLVTTVPSPNRRSAITPEIDIGLTPHNTVRARYEYLTFAQTNSGVGGASLASQAYDRQVRHQGLQVSDTEILSPSSINVLRYQFLHFSETENAANSQPAISVLGAFNGGGSPIGSYGNRETHNHVRDDLTDGFGNHQIELGGEVEDIGRTESTTANFNGEFVFPSLANYQATQQGLQNGETMAQLQAQGYGPSQFTMRVGQPRAAINRLDGADYIQDSWKARPNLMLTYGLRMETENVMADHLDWAPRLGLAWGLGRARATVVRAGFGVFYRRLDDDQMIVEAHQNGVNQLQYVINAPAFYPSLPGAGVLATEPASYPTVYRFAPNLSAPATTTTSVSVEHQFGPSASLSFSYRYSRGNGQFVNTDINAPLPGTYNPAIPASGTRPYGDAAGNIYEYQSAGIFRQQQLTLNYRMHFRNGSSLSGYYSYDDSHSDTLGGFAVDPWNLMADYGRAPWDMRHRLYVGGTVALPWGLRANPFVVAHSGQPFSITLGEDLFGTGQQNARPAPAGAGTPASDLVKTAYGNFNIAPTTNEPMIAPGTATGPAAFAVNLRLMKAFALGSAQPGRERPYRLEVGVAARNLINNVNLGTPVGDLLSSRFGQSLGLNGGEFSSGVANRRIDIVASFTF